MAASTYTRRLIIVVRSDLVTNGNTAANQSDTADNGDGSRTFTVGLSATGNLPATAYWCSWSMRPATALAIKQRLQDAGATVAETTPVAFPNGTSASNRFAVFDDSDGWDSEAILLKLGLKRIQVTLP